MPPPVNQAVDHFFRHESGKLTAVLSKLLGLQNLEVARDIVQDTLLQALSTWSLNGLPENPSAWLHRVAKNKAIDQMRRDKTFRQKISPGFSYLLQSESVLEPGIDLLFDDESIQDGQLKMIFACCHPSIPVESQIALSLKTLCGLSNNEIARAFFTSEETIAKRIYRAREKIRRENIQLELPPGNELPQRLDGVLKSLYLTFNEGYNSSQPDRLIREELCEDAMRLCYLLTQCPLTNHPATSALLSLFCFQTSRLQARLDDKGHIVLLKYQDRNKWFKPLIQKGFYYMDLAVTQPFQTSTFHIEAAIASLHGCAGSFEDTDWKGILLLYEQLHAINPGPVVKMNKAIAKAYASDKEGALQDLLELRGLEKYYLYHTAVGEILFEMGRKEEARRRYQAAMSLTQSNQEKQLLASKIKNCHEPGPHGS